MKFPPENSAPIFDIQHLCTHDGPGMRTVVFLKGCPLKCTWCSNPEGQASYPQLRWRSKKCANCFSCVNSCPRKAVSIEENEQGKFPAFNRSLCYDCNSRDCIENCPTDALVITGSTITADELFRILKKETRLYRNTGGGVTFSGGEPLMFPGFIGNVLKRLKEIGINTAIETCGFFQWDKAVETLQLCDMVYFDIKTADDEIHKKFTGKSNKVIWENLEKLSEMASGKCGNGNGNGNGDGDRDRNDDGEGNRNGDKYGNRDENEKQHVKRNNNYSSHHFPVGTACSCDHKQNLVPIEVSYDSCNKSKNISPEKNHADINAKERKFHVETNKTSEEAIKITVSIPIIPGVTDTIEKLKAIGIQVKKLNINRAKLLPYHRLSLGKYESLGLEYPHKDYDNDIERPLIEAMKRELEEMGIEVEE